MDTPKKIGRYEILEELGRGAMGTVYRAKDPAMDRVVALKTIISLVLASEHGDDFRERFYREARAAGALTHPGIVPVFDVGEHEGLPFLVMEFISGKTLADTIKKGERLKIDRVCEIGQKIADALGYAHQHGVVHRDIKPANILLTSKETHGIERPKITDFGVAKLAVGHTTLTGQILGTPAFMPPEQFTGAPIDGRADIFSLGVVLYWMATGEQPFPGESMTAVSYKVVHTEPVPPRKLNPSIPVKLESIILKCLAKNPDERYQTGEALAHELGELRTVITAVGLKIPEPEVEAAGSDPNATYIEHPSVARTDRTAVAQPPERVAKPEGASNNLRIWIALVIATIAAGGWFMLRHKESPAVQAPPSVTTSAALQTPAPPSTLAADSAAKPPAGIAGPAPVTPPVVKTSAQPSTKPATVLSKKADTQAAAEKIPPPAAEAPAPEPAAVDFNPKSLDPKINARLKIEADQVPANLDFTVEMNGKLYLRRSAEGNKREFDDLYVPPGVQEFRVTAGSGSVQKSSNTVSTEFKAKKRHTLKIELRTQGGATGAGMPQGLYPDTQLVLTLR
jgi:eukaryotic-like serine/threonine-protein kinase